MPKYRKLSLPEEFITSIEKHIEKYPHLAYTSVPDYLKAWARFGVRQEQRLAAADNEPPVEDDPSPKE